MREPAGRPARGRSVITLVGAVAAAALLAPAVATHGATEPRGGASRTLRSASSDPSDRRLPGGPVLPAFLVPNTGWTSSEVRWVAKCRGYRAFLMDDGVVLGVPSRRAGSAQRASTLRSGQFGSAAEEPDVPGANVRLRFDDVRSAPFAAGARLPGEANFFLGDDDSRWRSHVPMHTGVTRPDWIEGIDAEWRIDGSQLRFDLRLDAGTDPASIAVRCEGADAMRVTPDGGLVLTTGPGELRFSPPVAWQDATAGRRAVSARFALRDGHIGFDVSGRDASLPLVIDPVITYAAFFGGVAGDVIQGITVDAADASLFGGFTASVDFPVTSGAYQTVHAGGAGATYPNDYFAAKLLADGRTLAWCTFVGGSGWDDATTAAADASGAVYLAGSSASSNAPTPGGAQTAFGGGTHDGWVVKVAAGGAALDWGTYLGGSAGDSPNNLAVNSAGEAVVVGWTASQNFPTMSARQPSWGGSTSEGFVTKIAAGGGSLMFSTFHGGNGLDQCNAVDLDASGNVYVTGWTNSTNFATVAPIQATYTPSTAATPNDAFVSKFTSNGATLSYSTYYGGSSFDEGNAILVDTTGETYVLGWTGSSNFALRAPLQAQIRGSDDMFLIKLNAAGNATQWATYVGGGGREYGTALAFDAVGQPWCSGLSTSADFPTVNAVQSVFGGGGNANFPDDTVLFRVRPDGAKILTSTYFGGSNYEDTNAIGLDSAGALIIVGFTASYDLPVKNGWAGVFAGGQEGFIARIAPLVPTSPINLAATAALNQPVRLTWTDTSTIETGFEVDRRVDTGPWSVVKTLGPDVLTTNDSQVSPSVTFTYRVRAVNLDGTSLASNEVTITTPTAVPPPPTPTAPGNLLAIAVSTHEVDLDWEDRSDDERGFEVQRRIGGGNFASIGIIGANFDRYADDGRLTGWTYAYRVRAVATAGPSAFTNVAQATTPATMVFAVKKGKLVDSGSTSRDAVAASGTYSFGESSADAAWDPQADGLSVQLGGSGAAVLLSIPAGDKGWKARKGLRTWKSPKGSPFTALVKIDVTKRTWSVAFSKCSFPAVPALNVFVLLASGGDGGGSVTEWIEQRAGTYVAPKPAPTKR